MSCRKRLGIFSRSCKFEPRYDLSSPHFPRGEVSGWGICIDDFKSKTYVGDICVRCGKTVDRNDFKAVAEETKE
jgi:hypothetical protein